MDPIFIRWSIRWSPELVHVSRGSLGETMSQDSKYIEELRQKIAESFDRARQAEPKVVVDEARLKVQRDQFVELLFKSAERQLGR
jgi:hypothetical protein